MSKSEYKKFDRGLKVPTGKTDNYEREILFEPMLPPLTGSRYWDDYRTICVGLPVKDDAAAEIIFNANPPPWKQGHLPSGLQEN